MDRVTRLCGFVTLLWVVGCGGDGSDPLAPAGGAKFVWATIDGDPFIADTVWGGFFGDSLNVTGYGQRSNASRLTLVSLGIDGPGTYPMIIADSPDTYAGVSTSEGSFWTGFSVASGTLTLRTVTPTRLVGTFSFIAYYYSWDPPYTDDFVTVENGVIDITMP